MTIEGKEVLLTAPQFTARPKVAAKRRTSMVELSEAPRLAAYTGARVIHSLAFDFLFQSKAAVEAFEALFCQCRGRWADLWVPSWHAELDPTAGVADGTDELSISPVDYATIYDPSDADTTRLGHYVFLRSVSGTMHISKVLSVAGSSPEVLTLEDAVTEDFTFGSFFVGFLYHCRFTNDALAMKWSGPACAKTSALFIETLTLESEDDAT
jgi:hypothetical protein